MILSRTTIEEAVADACREAGSVGAAFAIGSYSTTQVAVEEFDFVVVLPEASRPLFPLLAGRLAHNFATYASDVALRLASHFVPRSYNHELTLHGAFYTDRDLTDRRPRLTSVLNERTRFWGDSSFVPKDVAPQAPYLDLVFGRWGLVNALIIMKEGGWTVPMWSFHRDPPVVEEVEYRLSDANVLIEVIWYFASKLTASVVTDLRDCGSSCTATLVVKELERIRPTILAARRKALSADIEAGAMSLWNDWVASFQALLEAAIAEERSNLQAAAQVNSSSLVSGSADKPR